MFSIEDYIFANNIKSISPSNMTLHKPNKLTIKYNFVKIVSNAIRTMPKHELISLKKLSNMDNHPECFNNFRSIEERVFALTFSDELSILDMLSSPHFYGLASIVGYVNKKPVFYFNGTGIYQWGETPDGQSISYWISYPAYPPGWEIN